MEQMMKTESSMTDAEFEHSVDAMVDGNLIVYVAPSWEHLFSIIESDLIDGFEGALATEDRRMWMGVHLSDTQRKIAEAWIEEYAKQVVQAFPFAKVRVTLELFDEPDGSGELPDWEFEDEALASEVRKELLPTEEEAKRFRDVMLRRFLGIAHRATRALPRRVGPLLAEVVTKAEASAA